MKQYLLAAIFGMIVVIGIGTVASAASYTAPVPVSPQDIGESSNYTGTVPGVHVTFTVNTDGSVSDVALQESSGNAAVDTAIIETVKTWRYTPAKDDKGEPVASGVTKYIDLP